MSDNDIILHSGSSSQKKAPALVAGDLDFQRLEEADIPELLALERACFSYPWGEKQFRLAFEQNLFKVFGMKQGRRLMAYVAFYHAADEMEILNVAVRDECRRLGVAKRLLGLVLQIARKMGINTVFLEVREHNEAALRLYAGFGFEHVGVRKNYYPDTKEDALVHKLELAPSDDSSNKESGADS